MTKIYEYTISTVNTAQVPVTAGKAYLVLHFERGQRGTVGQSQCPTYVSQNEIEQIIIEKSELFKSGAIRLKRQYGSDESAAAKPAPAKAPANKGKGKLADPVPVEPKDIPADPKGNDPIPVETPDEAENPILDSSAVEDAEKLPEITSKADLMKFLKSKGAKATDLKSDDAIKAFIAKKGLEIPNIEF